MTLSDKLHFIRKGRVTRRYHTQRMHDHQRVDAHSFGVAVIADLITPGKSAEDAAALFRASLYHDLAEHVTGDMPAPFKRALDIRHRVGVYEDELMERVGLNLPPMSSVLERALKIADAAEGCFHCIEEARMGNFDISWVFRNFWDYCIKEQKMGMRGQGVPDAWHIAESQLSVHIRQEWTDITGEEF